MTDPAVFTADREMFGDEPERFGLENVGNK